MREIKFRAWDKEDNKMQYGRYNVTPQGGNMVFMQFTGLKDKNGKEIYEGDIIENEHYGKEVVRFEHAGFIPFIGDELHHSWSAQLSKVMGNIYENPELLEAKPK